VSGEVLRPGEGKAKKNPNKLLSFLLGKKNQNKTLNSAIIPFASF